MLESKIQKAAGGVLIYSKKENVSDIHIEPREDCYKIRVRKDGVIKKSEFTKKTRDTSCSMLKKYGDDGYC